MSTDTSTTHPESWPEWSRRPAPGEDHGVDPLTPPRRGDVDPPPAVAPGGDDWGPDTGATTAEYAITTLAAVMT